MKKIFGIVLALFLVSQLTYAQGEKSLKMASKSFSQFSSDELLSLSVKMGIQYHVKFETEQFQMGAIGY